MLFVCAVGLGEVFEESAFFLVEFDGEANEGQGHTESAAVAGHEGEEGTEDGQQDAGVNRVARDGIGAGLDDFVVFLDGDEAAPVAAQVAAGPDGPAQAGGGEEGAEGFRAGGWGEDVAFEVGEMARDDDADDDEDEEDGPFDGRLAVDAFFDVLGGNDPDNEPAEPHEIDNDESCVEVPSHT